MCWTWMKMACWVTTRTTSVGSCPTTIDSTPGRSCLLHQRLAHHCDCSD
jgi:hypothetical protein